MLILSNNGKDLNLNDLLVKMKEKLPSYSVPLFVRLVSQIDTTGTMKFKKTDVKKEGFNIELIKDPLYVLDVKNSCYKELNRDTYDDILQCNVRF